LKKFKKLAVALGAVFLMLPVFAGVTSVGVKAYSIDTSHQLGINEGSNQRTNNRVIIAHETATYAPAVNNAIYMKNSWNTNYAYTQYVVGDWGKVYRVGADGYVSWGAGTWGNANAPVQVELARTYNNAQFKVDYAVYVNLLRDSAALGREQGHVVGLFTHSKLFTCSQQLGADLQGPLVLPHVA